MQTLGPGVPNFHPFHSTISRFRDIPYLRIFPLTQMLTFQSATKFLKLKQNYSDYTLTDDRSVLLNNMLVFTSVSNITGALFGRNPSQQRTQTHHKIKSLFFFENFYMHIYT